jgi:hypothetical protein
LKKIVLHLGLPKTATTLLQKNVFSQLDSHIDYLGVIQPRTVEQDRLFVEIMQAIKLDLNSFTNQLDDLKKKLDSRIVGSASPFLLSDECICIDSLFDGGSTNWQEKFQRLGMIFESYHLNILVTIRNPVSAVFSYYVECYQLLRSKYEGVVDFASKSNNARIYDYAYLDQIIEGAFKYKDINYVPFELIENKTFVKNVLNKLDFDFGIDFYTPLVNSKKHSSNGIKLSQGEPRLFFSLIKKVPIISLVYNKYRITLLKKIDFIINKKIVVSKMTSSEKDELLRIYSEATKFAEKKVGVKY